MFAYHVISYRSHTIHFLVSLGNFRRWTPPIQWRSGVLPWTSGALDLSSQRLVGPSRCDSTTTWWTGGTVRWRCEARRTSWAQLVLEDVESDVRQACGCEQLERRQDAYSMFQNLYLMQDAGRKLFDVA